MTSSAQGGRGFSIAISGGLGRIGTHCASLLAMEPRVSRLSLLVRRGTETRAAATCVELEDVSRGRVDVAASSDPAEAFAEAEVLVLCAAAKIPMDKGRGECLAENAEVLIEHCRAIRKAASPKAHVVVVANPVNTLAALAARLLPEAVTVSGVATVDAMRAVAVLRRNVRGLAAAAAAPGGRPSAIEVFGNHSGTKVVTSTGVEARLSALEEEIETRPYAVWRQSGDTPYLSGSVATFEHVMSLLTTDEPPDDFHVAVPVYDGVSEGPICPTVPQRLRGCASTHDLLASVGSVIAPGLAEALDELRAELGQVLPVECRGMAAPWSAGALSDAAVH